MVRTARVSPYVVVPHGDTATATKKSVDGCFLRRPFFFFFFFFLMLFFSDWTDCSDDTAPVGSAWAGGLAPVPQLGASSATGCGNENTEWHRPPCWVSKTASMFQSLMLLSLPPEANSPRGPTASRQQCLPA